MHFHDFLVNEIGGYVDDTSKVPKGYQLLGHVALLKVHEDLHSLLDEIGALTLEFEPRSKSVAVRTGETMGQKRIPNYSIVAGSKNTTTVHVENGVKFKLDPLQVTFSRGNVTERISLPQRVCSDEYVVDMFACVGQFALPIAYHAGSQVLAIEINEVAYDFLCQNIQMNNLEQSVRAVFGNCLDVEFNEADRVVMGYLHDTIDYLPKALNGVSSSGGVIHMHNLVRENTTKSFCNTIITMALEYNFLADVSTRIVKKYSPGIYHMVFDIELTTNR